jgi:hypothetical protein
MTVIAVLNELDLLGSEALRAFFRFATLHEPGVLSHTDVTLDSEVLDLGSVFEGTVLRVFT